MTRRKSESNFFGKTFREAKRQFPLLFLTFVLMFISMPAAILLNIQSQKQSFGPPSGSGFEEVQEIARDVYEGIGSGFVLMLIPILVAAVLFHYLHVSQQTNFYHAQPMKRGELFAVRFFSGIMIMLPSYLICVMAMFAVCSFSGYGGVLSAKMIGYKLVTDLALMFIVYAVSVLACVLAGTAVAALVLNFGMQFGLFALWVSGLTVIHWFFPSMLMIFEDSTFGCTSPIYFRACRFFNEYFVFSNAEGLDKYYDETYLHTSAAYILVALVIVILAVSLYKFRKSERTGSAIVFRGLRLPVKYIAMTISAVFMGEILYLSSGLKITFYLGMAIGILAAHFVLEILFEKSLGAMFSHQLSLWIYTAAAVVCVVLFRLDITGYNTQLPNRADIIGANVVSANESLSCSLINNDVKSDAEPWTGRWQYDNAVGNMLKQYDNIEAVYAMAQRGSQSMKEHRIGISLNDEYVIAFELRDGSHFVRSYHLASKYAEGEEFNVLKKRAAGVRFSEEYLNTRTAAALADSSKADFISVQNGTNLYSGTYIDDKQAVKNIVDTLKEESLLLTEDYVKEHLPIMMVSVESDVQHEKNDGGYNLSGYEEGRFNIPIYSIEKKTVALLREQGIKPARYDYDLIDSIDLRVTEIREEGYGTMLTKAEHEVWHGTVENKRDFEYVLSGSAAEGILECCDPVAMDMQDKTHEISISIKDGIGEVSVVSAKYMTDKIPLGLGRYRTDDGTEQ